MAVASVVATALFVVVLVTWAASIGPSQVLRGDGPEPAGTPTVSESTAPSSAVQPAPPPEPSEESSESPERFRVIALVIDILATLLAAYLLLRLVRWGHRTRRERRASRRREATADAVAFEVVEPPAAVAREMLADAGAQRQVLLAGSPRNAVVACWHRFETQAEAAGLARRPWETSSEFTMRVLDLVDAYEPAVSRLGALYREARFSEHDLTESARQEALDALDTIHRTIGVVA